jgi:hypothetical protein
MATADGAEGQCTTSFGPFGAGGVCFSASDCAPGFGCVHPGVCRAYCCGDVEACPESTFCKTSTMISDVQAASLTIKSPIPTCAPITPCALLDDTSCPGELVCTIVREDGTTSCDTPGEGLAGDECPCAKDHVCAQGVNECFKICALSDPATCPPNHTCQGGSKSYPDGFGVCVSN